MENTPKLIEYLNKRPFAPILERINHDELADEIALKFMCIVDYEVTKRNFYARISDTNFPKLLYELLGFYSYKNFRFYDYIGNKRFADKQLQCKFAQCQFFGPYLSVLTHMSINHNMHFGLVLCAYCCNHELQQHFADNSFEACYEKYLKREEVPDVAAEIVCQIISDFYCMLKKCSQKLKVYTRRQLNCYSGKGRGKGKREQLLGSCESDISKRILVFQPKPSTKSFSINELNQEFNSAMENIYRTSGSSLLLKVPESPAAVLISDSEDEATEQKFPRIEQQPSGMRILRVNSLPLQSYAASSTQFNGMSHFGDSHQNWDEPSTSGRSISSVNSLRNQSNTTFEMPTQFNEMSQSHLEDLDPFLRYLNSGFKSIRNKRQRRQLEDVFMKELRKAQDKDSR